MHTDHHCYADCYEAWHNCLCDLCDPSNESLPSHESLFY